jgi:hypothetical protein
LSAVSQTLETQTKVAAELVQLPLSVGEVWVGSLGIGEPLGRSVSQVVTAMSHHLPGHCTSEEQPPGAGMTRQMWLGSWQ